MAIIKYVIRMDVIDVHIECISYNTSRFKVYDTLGEAIEECNWQVKWLKGDYVDGPCPDQESITIMTLYAAKVTQDCRHAPKKYAIRDVICHTIAQYGSIKTFWDRLCDDNDDWEDCK